MQQAKAYAFTGAAGGAAAAVVMHPLDVLRVRLSVQDASLLHDNRARGVLACIADIYTHEGMRGFMRGVGPATLAIGCSWGLFELAREVVVRPWRAAGAHGTQGLSRGQVMATSVAASALIAPLMNPLFLAKTRMQTALMEGRGVPSSPGVGLARTLINIVKADGLRGTMIGLGPGLLNTLTGGVQQVAIHTFKEWGGHGAGLLPLLGGVGAATLAGRIAAMTLLYPVQVVRTRMQQMPPGSQGGHAPVSVAQNPYRSIAGTVRLMWAREGVAAFYKGFTPSLLRGGMQASVAASIIETGKAVYHRWEGGMGQARS